MNFLSGNKPQDDSQTQSQSGGGLMGTINNALGGGQSGERKEGSMHRTYNHLIVYSHCVLDPLDKSIP